MWRNVYEQSTESKGLRNPGSALQTAFRSLTDTAAIGRLLRALLTEASEAGLGEEILAGVMSGCLLDHPLLHSSPVRWHAAKCSLFLLKKSIFFQTP